MFERERRMYADQYGYIRELVADLPDEELADQPVPGLNHPAWTLGHLVIAADYGLAVLGEPTLAPEGWGALFNPGTVPDPTRGTYPSKGELMNAYEAGHAALVLEVVQDAAVAGHHGHGLGLLRIHKHPISLTEVE